MHKQTQENRKDAQHLYLRGHNSGQWAIYGKDIFHTGQR